jgi:hypothetical protein
MLRAATMILPRRFVSETVFNREIFRNEPWHTGEWKISSGFIEF